MITHLQEYSQNSLVIICRYWQCWFAVWITPLTNNHWSFCIHVLYSPSPMEDKWDNSLSSLDRKNIICSLGSWTCTTQNLKLVKLRGFCFTHVQGPLNIRFFSLSNDEIAIKPRKKLKNSLWNSCFSKTSLRESILTFFLYYKWSIDSKQSLEEICLQPMAICVFLY